MAVMGDIVVDDYQTSRARRFAGVDYPRARPIVKAVTSMGALLQPENLRQTRTPLVA